MISGLDTKFEAREQQTYEDLPNGKYLVKVKEIEDWEKQTVKNALVTERDERGYPKKDEKGKTIKVRVPELNYYVAKIKFEVIEGQHKGRLIFERLTTHPDGKFMTEAFLFATNKTEVIASEIQKECLNAVLTVDCISKEYSKVVTDPQTGIDTTETRKAFNVKTYLKPETLVQEEGANLGI